MQLILVLLCRGKYGCVVILCRTVALVDEIVAASLCLFGCVLICLEFLASGVKIGLGLFKLGALIAYRLLLLIEFALTAAYLLFKLAYLLFAGGKLMPASRSGIAKKHPSLRTPASAFSSPGRFMTFSP